MEFDLKKLNYLVTVARVGSFSRAADELHITQPALSRSIAALEDQLGVQVFERSRNGVALTRLGKLAVEEAEALLARSRLLRRKLSLYQQGEAGSVAFGMGPLIGSLTLPWLSSHLLNQHPRLETRAAVKSVDMLAAELMRGDIEMIFCGQGQLEITDNLSLELIGSIPLALLVCADHPLLRKKTVRQADLNDYATLCAVEMSGFPSEHGRGYFICDNYDILRSTAQDTRGIWISSPLLAQRELREGKLKQLLVEGGNRTSVIEVSMVRLADSKLSPAAQLVAGYLRRYFAEGAS